VGRKPAQSGETYTTSSSDPKGLMPCFRLYRDVVDRVGQLETKVAIEEAQYNESNIEVQLQLIIITTPLIRAVVQNRSRRATYQT
jgi:hypothetical protein